MNPTVNTKPCLLVLAGVVLGLATAGCSSDEQKPGNGSSDLRSSVDELVKAGQLAKLGPPSIPLDNPQTVDANGWPLPDDPKVQLGKLLFFDSRLSGDGVMACVTCHQPSLGWGDGLTVGMGYQGTLHWRNSQSVINSAHLGKLFWAGGAKSLEGQAHSAATGAVAGNGEVDVMEERLRQVPDYMRRFKEVFGTPVPFIRDAWDAVAAYERTLIQRDDPLDRFLGGDDSALSAKAQEGLALFVGKADCIRCHNGPMLTDEKFYNLGVPENPEFESNALRQITFRYQQYSKGNTEEIYRSTRTDLGLYYRTKRKADMGKFRTAPLRYVAHTAPFMHNGTMATLEDVIAFYDQGGGEDPIEKQYSLSTKDPALKPLGLSADERAALVAFLKELSGEVIDSPVPELPPYGAFRAK